MWLSRFIPKRQRPREVLVDDQRLRLLAGVAENDNCLRAVLDLAQEKMECEFHQVIDPQLPAEQRSRACDGLRVAYHFLTSLEAELAAAKAWREEQERRKS